MFLSHDILRDKFRGAILGCFLGDAFGSGFEGMHPDKAKFHMSNLSKTFTRSYTDDTDMTLALAESIIESGEVIQKTLQNSSVSLVISPVGMPSERSKLSLRSGLE